MEASFLVWWYILTISRLGLGTLVIGWSSRSQQWKMLIFATWHRPQDTHIHMHTHTHYENISWTSYAQVKINVTCMSRHKMHVNPKSTKSLPPQGVRILSFFSVLRVRLPLKEIPGFAMFVVQFKTVARVYGFWISCFLGNWRLAKICHG